MLLFVERKRHFFHWPQGIFVLVGLRPVAQAFCGLPRNVGGRVLPGISDMSETIGSEVIRPLSLGEILDRTTQLYRRNFLCFAGVAAVPTAVILAAVVPAAALLFVPAVAAGRRHGPMSGGFLVLFIVVMLVVGLVTMAATVISQAGLIRAVIAAYNGQKLRIREALKSAWPGFPRYLGLLFLQGIWVALIPVVVASVAIAIVFLLARAAGGGFATNAASGFGVFLIAAATVVIVVIRGLTYSLGMPVCIAEDKPAWESLMRSKKLSKGTRGRIFLMFLLVWLLSVVVSMIGYIPILIVTIVVAAMGKSAGSAATGAVLLVIGEIVNVLVNFTIQTLITPVYLIGLVLFYFDQRIRTEGYDIEWMMQRAGLASSGTQPQAQTAPGTAAGGGPDSGTLIG